MDNSILFDDYSSSNEDPGLEIEIPSRGKLLKFRIKRALNLDERQRATKVGVIIGLDDKGAPTLQQMDQAAYTKELLLVVLKQWPFVYSSGSPVPITRDTVALLDASLADSIIAIVMGRTPDMAPFGKKSGEGS